MDEHQAIDRVKRGDLDGLEPLARAYYLPAVRAAFLVTGDAAIAEDVAQSAFVELPRKIRSFDAAREFRPWFLRSVVNAATSACRGAKNIALPDDDLAVERLAALAGDPGPEEACITAETRRAVQQALNQLSPAQRAAVVLRYYLELNEDEMTHALGRPRSTVKWLLFAARQKLRRLLDPSSDPEMHMETSNPKKERI